MQTLKWAMKNTTPKSTIKALKMKLFSLKKKKSFERILISKYQLQKLGFFWIFLSAKLQN